MARGIIRSRVPASRAHRRAAIAFTKSAVGPTQRQKPRCVSFARRVNVLRAMHRDDTVYQPATNTTAWQRL
jgi:hypothetical protein